MKYTVYVETVKELTTALGSDCDGVRFGSEFCPWKVPSLNSLKAAHMMSLERGREFTYVTPRISSCDLGKVVDQLAYLHDHRSNSTRVVVNDLGVLNVLSEGEFLGLSPHLGRQLISVPLRGRPPMAELMRGGGLKQFVARQIFNRSNLNHGLTIDFLKDLGVKGVDMDWLPDGFPHLNRIARRGLHVAIHSHLSLIALTRMCHTARLMGEQAPEMCSQPCLRRAFVLKHPLLGEMYLLGDALFGVVQPAPCQAQGIRSGGIKEIVLSLNALTRLFDTEDINRCIAQYRLWFD